MPRRLARWSMALVVAMAVPACRAQPTAVRTGGGSAPLGVAISPAAAAAQALAASLLDQVILPPGTKVTTTMPAALDRLFSSPPTPNLIDLHRMFLVPGLAPEAVKDYLGRLPAPGFTVDGMGRLSHDGIFIVESGDPSDPAGHPRLDEQMVAAPGGGTLVRADAWIVWLPSRSPGEVVTGSDVTVVVSDRGMPMGGVPAPQSIELTVTDTVGAARLIRDFNAIPTAAPGMPFGCIAHAGWTLAVTFTASGQAIAAQEDSCGHLMVTVGSSGAQDLQDSGSFEQDLVSLLGSPR